MTPKLKKRLGERDFQVAQMKRHRKRGVGDVKGRKLGALQTNSGNKYKLFWNEGMMEYWNIGRSFGCFGLNPIIPLFQYSSWFAGSA